MASRVYLGNLYPEQRKMTPLKWSSTLYSFRGIGKQAVIAKGNIIEGIEAKE